jgi:hypothetical protein
MQLFWLPILILVNPLRRFWLMAEGTSKHKTNWVQGVGVTTTWLDRAVYFRNKKTKVQTINRQMPENRASQLEPRKNWYILVTIRWN